MNKAEKDEVEQIVKGVENLRLMPDKINILKIKCADLKQAYDHQQRFRFWATCATIAQIVLSALVVSSAGLVVLGVSQQLQSIITFSVGLLSVILVGLTTFTQPGNKYIAWADRAFLIWQEFRAYIDLQEPYHGSEHDMVYDDFITNYFKIDMETRKKHRALQNSRFANLPQLPK